jgi:hypothetical protein
LAGDDEITATFSAPGDSTFQFRADLGAGDDRLSISGFDPQPDPPLRSVGFDIRAGSCNDEIAARFACPSDHFHFRAALGAGDDKLSISGFDPQPDPPLASAEFDIRAGAGDDEIAFDLGGAEIKGRFVISAHGGSGNDRLSLGTVQPCFLPESELRIGFFGEAGEDLIEVSMRGAENEGGRLVLDAAGGPGNDHLVLGAAEPCWLPGSETRIGLLGNSGDDLIDVSLVDAEIEGLFNLAVLGGEGNDILESFIVPCVLPAGRASFLFDGDAGADRIVARFEADYDSRGALDVRVLGGLGDDDLTLALLGVDDLALLMALVDGGREFDVGRVTRNVRVVNCEEVIFLDEPR